MKTYALLNPNLEVMETGLTLEEAAIEILTYDSQQYEIRPAYDGHDGHDLWTKRLNRLWDRTTIFSLNNYVEDATKEIFEQVVDADWPNHPAAICETE